jgi:hypothetical protein
MPEARFAHCLFCDDVRQEVGGKLSYMGIYGSDMIFPPGATPGIPILVQKLIVVVWIVSDIDDKPTKAAFVIYGPPNRTEIARIEVDPSMLAPIQISKDARKHRLQGVLPLLNIVFDNAGIIEVSVETERETILAGRLKIVLQESEGLEANPSTPTA